MTRDEKISLAKEKATEIFNALPIEIRRQLANGYERLQEINLVLNFGDSLSMRKIKERKKQLEEWLLEWYNETGQKGGEE